MRIAYASAGFMRERQQANRWFHYVISVMRFDQSSRFPKRRRMPVEVMVVFISSNLIVRKHVNRDGQILPMFNIGSGGESADGEGVLHGLDGFGARRVSAPAGAFVGFFSFFGSR